MLSQLQVIGGQGFKDVRCVEVDGKPYFVALDIAKILGYTNPSKTIKDHCIKVKQHKINTNRGLQTLNIIPESDIYRLIIRSKLPEADKFERWLMDEVLPTMRKTGGYVADPSQFVDVYFPTLSEEARQIMKDDLAAKHAQKGIISKEGC